MFDWKNLEEHKNIFSQAGKGLYFENFGQHHIDTRPKDLLRWIELCKDDLDYFTLVDITAVDHSEFPSKLGHSLELVYVLFNMGNHQRLNIHVHFNRGEIVPSVASHFLHAEWMEREQAEMLGLTFHPPKENLILPKGSNFRPLEKKEIGKIWQEDLPMEAPPLRMNPNKSEAPYPEESWTWKKFGLLSPETRGNFEWLVCFNPIKVVDSKTRIGFHHRGWEKVLESKSWVHVMQLVDLIQPGVAPTYSIAWAKTLEEMLRIKLPERAQAIRIVMLELARIAEHLTVLHEITWALKKEEHVFFIDAREKVYELFEKYCGQRLGTGMVCVGGVREDLPHGWIIEFQEVSDILRKNLRIIHRSLISQRDFRSHLNNSGVNAQTVLQWGIGGPTMRASGLNFDLRKSQPLYFYQDVDFDVPVGIHGTSYDRYLIRYEEIHQSLRIITQVLDNLPLGEVINPIYAEAHMDPERALNELVPGLWHYSSLEGPNGEVGFHHLSSQGANPYRLKIKSPSLTLVQALPEFVRGLEECQLPGTLASLGIRKSELDR